MVSFYSSEFIFIFPYMFIYVTLWSYMYMLSSLQPGTASSDAAVQLEQRSCHVHAYPLLVAAGVSEGTSPPSHRHSIFPFLVLLFCPSLFSVHLFVHIYFPGRPDTVVQLRQRSSQGRTCSFSSRQPLAASTWTGLPKVRRCFSALPYFHLEFLLVVLRPSVCFPL